MYQQAEDLQLSDAAVSVTRIRLPNNKYIEIVSRKVQIYGDMGHQGLHIIRLLKCPNSKAPPISFSC